jgi:hypothetical protein
MAFHNAAGFDVRMAFIPSTDELLLTHLEHTCFRIASMVETLNGQPPFLPRNAHRNSPNAQRSPAILLA